MKGVSTFNCHLFLYKHSSNQVTTNFSVFASNPRKINETLNMILGGILDANNVIKHEGESSPSLNIGIFDVEVRLDAHRLLLAKPTIIATLTAQAKLSL